MTSNLLKGRSSLCQVVETLSGTLTDCSGKRDNTQIKLDPWDDSLLVEKVDELLPSVG